MAEVGGVITERRKKVCKEGVDRISNLPPDATERILLRLPLKEAAKMSILSSHWRYQWTLLPQLILDPILYLNVFKWSFVHRGTTQDETDKFTRLVNDILLRHVGPIIKFFFDLPGWCPSNIDISQWIQFVSSKSVKDFTLRQRNVYADYPKRNVPSTMFSLVGFNCMTRLALVNFSLGCLPTTFKGFPCLTTLEFQFYCSTTGEADKLGFLVSKCPLLETLDIWIIEAISTLVIHAPKLKKLILSGSLDRFCLEETKTIKELILECKLPRQKRDKIVELLLTSFPNCLTHLTLIKSSLGRLPTTFRGFPCLTSLQFQLNCITTDEAAKLGFLVSKCPLLETLDVRIYETLSTLIIHAPMLKKLILNGSLDGFCLEETKSLKELILQSRLLCKKRDTMVKLFTYFPYLVNLNLACDFWLGNWVKEAGPFEKLQLPCGLILLKHLELTEVPLHKVTTSFIFWLLWNSPNLETLRIDTYSMIQASQEDMMVDEEDWPCYCNLKWVKLRFDKPTKAVLKLIKLIIMSSPALQELTFDAGVRSSKRKLTMAQELLRTQRASPNGKIFFKPF